MKKLLAIILVLNCQVLFYLGAQNTLNVGIDEDYETIVEALDAANNGDIINIVDPVHAENNVIVNKSVVIQGQGAFNTTIDGGTVDPMNPQGRIFYIEMGNTVTIQDLTITRGGGFRGSDGTDSTNPDGTRGDDGGAILNEGRLTVDRCMFFENMAGFGGDGIEGADGGDGGPPGSERPGGPGMRGGHGGDGGHGGAIANYSVLVVKNSTFFNNVAGMGGNGANGGNGGKGADGLLGASLNGGDGGSGGDGGNAGFGGFGGAIANISIGDAIITNSTFTENMTGAPGMIAGMGGTGGMGGLGVDAEASELVPGGNGGHGAVGGNGGNAGKAGDGGAIANVNDGVVQSINNTISNNFTAFIEGVMPGMGGMGGDGANSGIGNVGPGMPGNGGDGGNGGIGVFAGEGGGISNSNMGSFGIINTIVANNTFMSGFYQGGAPGMGGMGGMDPNGIPGMPGNPGFEGPPGGETPSPNCIGEFNSQGTNIVSDPQGSIGWIGTDIHGEDPDLEGLAKNGGPTKTMAIPETSPANAAAQSSHASLDIPDHDQRLFNRQEFPYGYDIGAYEYRTISDDLVINEVDITQEGAEDTEEFIEIFDGGVGDYPLDELVIVLFDGETNESYNAIDLEGYRTNDAGYFVIGSADVPNVDLVAFNTDEIVSDNPGAVLLYKGIAHNFPDGTDVSDVEDNNIIDALVYDTGQPDNLDLLTLLNPGEPQINADMYSNADLESMQRIPNGAGGQRNTSTYMTTEPTPGAENFIPPLIEVNPDFLDFEMVLVDESKELSYDLVALFLTDNFVINTPDGFQVSLTSGSDFSNDLVIEPVGGEINTTIYVQFSPTEEMNYTGYISNESDGAETKNVTVNGQGVMPNIEVTPESLDFEEVLVGTTKELFYELNAEYLTEDLVINTPDGFQVSLISGSDFGDDLVIEPAEGEIDTIVYVLFSPTEDINYTGAITNVSIGAAPQDVMVSGNGVIQSLSVNPLSLDFGEVVVDSSEEMQYEVSGENLTDDIVITAPSGFQVSETSGSGFDNSIAITPFEGEVDAVIYVLFSPDSEGLYSGDISNETDGVAIQNVTVSGTGVVPEISVVPGSLDFGDVLVDSSEEMQYEVSGVNLTDDVVITAPSGFEVSETSGFGFESSIELTPVDGEVDAVIYVLFSPDSEGPYSGDISNESDGATTQNVSVSGAGVVPEISVVPTSLDFGEVIVGSTEELQYEISGENLTDNVVITAPSGFEVSETSGSDFESSIELTPVDGELDATIYVLFSPDSEGTYSGNITNESDGAETKNVTVSGEGVPAGTPILSVNPTYLDFESVYVGESEEFSYTLNGENLTDDVTITAPAGFEVSETSGSGFSGTIDISPVGGEISTTIYVLFSPGSESNYDDNVTNESSGATTRTVNVVGEGIVPSLFVNTETLDFGNVNVGGSKEMFYVLTGENLLSDVDIEAPAGFEISLTSGADFESSISIAPVDGSVDETIYVLFSPDSETEYSGNITNESIDVSEEVSVTGNGVESFLAVDPDELAFGDVLVGEVEELSYELTGNNLTDNVIITAPDGFKVSLTSGSDFENSIEISVTKGTIDETIYVQFAPETATLYSDDIENESEGATSMYVEVSGTGIESPAISVEPETLSFENVHVGDEVEMSYVLTGENLTDDITVSAPDGFQVSETSGMDFESSINVSATEGSVNTTIFVQFSPDSEIAYSDNITNESDGADTKNVLVTGVGVVPEITVTPEALDFGEVQIGSSFEMSYQLTGDNLKEDILVEVPGGFRVSETSGADFENSITVTHLEGAVNTTIYVLFEPTDEVLYSEDITNSSDDAETKFVNVNGEGVPEGTPILNTSVDFLDFDIVQTGMHSEQFYILTGINLDDDVIIETPQGFRVSETSGSGFVNTLEISPDAEGEINSVIYVRFSPVDEMEYDGNITNQSAGATTRNVEVIGEGVESTLTANPETLDFGDVLVESSSELSYHLEGNNIFEDVVITAPDGFRVSKTSGADFENSITVSPDEGSVDATIYVEFSPESEMSYIGYVTNECPGVATVNVTVMGEGIPEGTPIIYTSVGSVDFGEVMVDSYEDESYNIAAYNFSDDMTISLSGSGFEISEDGVDFDTEDILLSPTTDGEIFAQIWVRFMPESVGNHTGMISHSGAKEALASVDLEGVGVEQTLVVSPSSLDFEDVETGTSEVLYYSLEGQNLTDNVIITAPSGFQVSQTSGSGFSNSIEISPILGEIDASIYVMFSPETESSYSGDISNESDGAETQYVSVSGNGITNIEVTEFINNISVYPNPVYDKLFIEYKDSKKPVNIKMISITGQIIEEDEFTGKTVVKTNDIEPGMYLLKLESEGETGYIKIIKK